MRNSDGTVVSVLLVTSGQYQGKYILPAGKVEDSDLSADDAALRSATPLCATSLFIKCSGANAKAGNCERRRVWRG